MILTDPFSALLLVRSAVSQTNEIDSVKRSFLPKASNAWGCTSGVYSQDSQPMQTSGETSGPKPITDAQDYLGLVNKAAVSAEKDMLSPLEDLTEILGERSFKWLQRAEGSVFRSPDIIAMTQTHYANKMASRNTLEDQSRAHTKGSNWVGVSGLMRNEYNEYLVTTAGQRYLQDAQNLYNQYMQLQANAFAPEAAKEDITRKLTHAQEVLQKWDTTNAEGAALMTKMELNSFAKAARKLNEHSTPEVQAEVTDYATKAIAWSIKTRQLLMQGRVADTGMQDAVM